MADISKVTLPNGTTYDIKDSTARTTASGKSTVSVNRKVNTGTNIYDITIDNTTTPIYAPSGGGGGGGSTVSITVDTITHTMVVVTDIVSGDEVEY